MDPVPEPPRSGDFRVLWTRGDGCGELAALLDPGARRATGDLQQACISAAANLVVARKLLPSFDLVSLAVPVSFRPGSVGSITAAVGGGPHSGLAARVAAELGRSFQVPAAMVCAYRDDEGKGEAVTLIENLAAQVPTLEYRIVHAPTVEDLIAGLEDDTLVVFGAPGGSWLQRLLFGTGARLRHRAPNGAVIVREAEPRVFHRLVEPVYVSRHMRAADALRLTSEQVLPVVDHGTLVGVVRRRVLLTAGETPTVGDLMEAPVSVPIDGTEADLTVAGRVLGGGPVPVVDEHGRLIGTVEPRPD